MASRGGKDDQRSAVTAAATRIDLRQKRDGIRRQTVENRQDWYPEAWAFFDLNPEVGHAVEFRGNALAKATLYVGVQGEPGEDPVPVTDPTSGVNANVAALATEELERLRSELGGQAEIIRTLCMNLDVIGEGYIVGIRERPPTDEAKEKAAAELKPPPGPDPERWEVVSTDEIEVNTRGEVTVKIAGGNAKGVTLIRDGNPLDPNRRDDVLVRVWTRHPRWMGKSMSPMRRVILDCRIIEALTYQELATAQSQLNSGFLIMPNGLSVGGATSMVPATGDDHAQDPLDAIIDRIFSEPIGDPDSLGTVRPTVVRGENEDLTPDVLRFMDTARQFDSTIPDRIEKRVARVARGLNVPVEVVMGLMQTTFANAAQVDRNTFDDYLQPTLALICDAIAVGYLRPSLIELGVDPALVDELTVWYDPTPLLTQPEKADSATEGVKLGAVSRAAWRAAKAWDEDDAPDDDEAAANIALAQPAQPAAVPAEPVVAAGVRIPTLGAQLAKIDQRLQDRLAVAASGAMERALERAGNRLRNRVRGTSNADLVAAVPARLVAATLGPTLTAAANDDKDDLFAGAFVGYTTYQATQTRKAQAQARTAAGRAVTLSPDLEAQQEADLAESVAWTDEELTAVAAHRLFDPDPALAIGEADPSEAVPRGLIRQAMARAGGFRGLTGMGEDGGYLVLRADSPVAAGGVATGETIMGALRDGGVVVDGWEWQVGDPQNPLEVHQALDGVQFAAPDDPQLINPDPVFPPYEFLFAGDHSGCQCSWIPTLVRVDDGGDA